MMIPFAQSPRRRSLTTDDCRLSTLPLFNFSLTTVYCLLSTLLLSCTSPTPPPPPPAGPDTTSHDFIWRIDTLGDGNSSVLYDVAIINDTTVWAVGEIFVRDSSGQIDPTPYNLAAWNGRMWKLRRVPAATYGGPEFSSPLHAIFAFSSDDVWTFSIAGSYSRWNGSNWATAFVSQRSGSVMKMWGSSSADLYAVGTNGSLSRFNGSTWTLLASGTTLDLYDVWGGKNAAGVTEIIAVGASLFHSLDRIILRIDGSSVTTLSDSTIRSSLRGIWFESGKMYVLAGGGIYRKSALQEQIWSGPLQETQYYSYAVRGSSEKNVFVVGAYNDVLHYNGSTWRTYSEFFRPNDMFLAVAVTPRLVVAVGSSGIVARGRPVGH